MYSLLRTLRSTCALRPCSRKLYTSTTLKSPIRTSVDLMFGKYLLTTNIVSSGILMALGDVIQQEIEYRQKLSMKRYNYERIWQMFLVGLSQGPLHHWMYTFLDRWLPGKDLRTVSKKILFDQIIASPVFIVTFFWGIGLLEKKTFKEMNAELKDKMLFIYAADWIVWPPTQFINFYYLAPQYRVLYINAVTMGYDIFLSYAKYNDVRFFKDKPLQEECQT